MALANVALTDTFDYWRTVTNSLVVVLNDKLVYCNTSNANTVSIPSFASRTSNLYVNIITSTSINDVSTSNIASAFTANTIHNAALTYTAAANSNAATSVASANAYTNNIVASVNAWIDIVKASGNSWTNGVAAAGNAWANTVGTAGNNYTRAVGTSGNNYTNYVGVSGNNYSIYYTNLVGFSGNTYSATTYAPKISPTFTGTVTINAHIANQTLTDGGTIYWDVSQGSVATVTLGGNRAMAAPTNLKIGTYILHVVQDGSGNRSLSWDSVFKWPAGVAPTLTTTANRRDMFSFVSDGTNLYGSYLPDVR